MEEVKQSKSAIQNQMQEEYLKDLDKLTEGDLVSGHVVQVSREFVFVDVGYKSEGMIPVEEFDGELPNIGDSITVVLIKKETRNGIVLSKKKATEKSFWRDFSTAFKDSLPVEGTITKEIKGGYEVNLGHGLTGFLPSSKADVQRIEDSTSLIGTKTSFYLERLYSDRKVNIVLNRRKYLEELSTTGRTAFFQTAQIGDTVRGEVKSFTSFGAFIDLGGFDGLLHINDMSWGHVARPRDFVKKGDVIDLKVIKLEPETGRINLSLKHFHDDPWNNFEDRYHINDIIHGKVTKLAEYGAFIELEEGIEGLAHISEFSWTRKINKPGEMLKVGDEVDAMILGYDLQAGKVSLGLKQVQSNPWDQVSEKYPLGLRLSRPVKELLPNGLTVELEEGIEGFLHVEDISWTEHVKDIASKYKVGDSIDFVIIASDTTNRNIKIGVKQLSDDPWKNFTQAFHVGSIVDGKVSRIADFGLFVKVQGDIEGLLRKQELTNNKDESYDEALKKYAVDQEIKAVVVELNAGKQKLGLSIRDLEKRQEREELSRFLHKEEDAGAYTLGAALRKNEDK